MPGAADVVLDGQQEGLVARDLGQRALGVLVDLGVVVQLGQELGEPAVLGHRGHAQEELRFASSFCEIASSDSRSSFCHSPSIRPFNARSPGGDGLRGQVLERLDELLELVLVPELDLDLVRARRAP